VADVFEADVLIIGSGGAGLMAAIQADAASSKVIVVTKDKLASGCTPISMGGAQVAYDPKDSQDAHFRDTVLGSGLVCNQRLVRTMVSEALERVQDLERFGTTFLKQGDRYKLFPFSGCSFPRAVTSTDPYRGGFIKGLVEETNRREIQVLENVMVTTLVKHAAEVIGAAGIDLETGKFLVFDAKSTVLASGGAGQLYSLTTNPAVVTGDGYALAYDVGADLVDMEFVQMRASIVHPMKLRGEPPPSDGLVTVGGRFYNILGERYMKKYHPGRCEDVTRAEMMLATYKEVKRGAGTPRGGVYNDLSGVPEGELKRFEKFMKACEAEGIDPTWQPIEWAPGVHHFMGGVKINERCETSSPGLFAAGEVAGGVHGANRMAGNALTDILVFGARAGKFGAERSCSANVHKADEKQISDEQNRVLNIYERKEGADPVEVRKEIQSIMDYRVGLARNAEDLNKAICGLERIKRETLPRNCILGEKTPRKLGYLLELENLTDVGLIVSRAALLRTESRGAHYREDYPERDDRNWLKNIVVKRVNGEMKLETRPVSFTELAP